MNDAPPEPPEAAEQPEPREEPDPFARKKPKPAPRPNALAEDGRAPDERALDPFTDDDLHRAN